jgi:hypothetical protein
MKSDTIRARQLESLRQYSRELQTRLGGNTPREALQRARKQIETNE